MERHDGNSYQYILDNLGLTPEQAIGELELAYEGVAIDDPERTKHDTDYAEARLTLEKRRSEEEAAKVKVVNDKKPSDSCDSECAFCTEDCQDRKEKNKEEEVNNSKKTKDGGAKDKKNDPSAYVRAQYENRILFYLMSSDDNRHERVQELKKELREIFGVDSISESYQQRLEKAQDDLKFEEEKTQARVSMLEKRPVLSLGPEDLNLLFLYSDEESRKELYWDMIVKGKSQEELEEIVSSLLLEQRFVDMAQGALDTKKRLTKERLQKKVDDMSAVEELEEALFQNERPLDDRLRILKKIVSRIDLEQAEELLGRMFNQMDPDEYLIELLETKIDSKKARDKSRKRRKKGVSNEEDNETREMPRTLKILAGVSVCIFAMIGIVFATIGVKIFSGIVFLVVAVGAVFSFVPAIAKLIPRGIKDAIGVVSAIAMTTYWIAMLALILFWQHLLFPNWVPYPSEQAEQNQTFAADTTTETDVISSSGIAELRLSNFGIEAEDDYRVRPLVLTTSESSARQILLDRFGIDYLGSPLYSLAYGIEGVGNEVLVLLPYDATPKNLYLNQDHYWFDDAGGYDTGTFNLQLQ